MKLILIFFSVLFLIFPNSSFAEKSTYLLEIDEHSYILEYEIDADVLEMAIDGELTSFLIGIEKTQDSVFFMNLPSELISAENNEFAVLVDGFEVDYELESSETSSDISFFVPEGSQEIEIIGTQVIPEFPIGLLFIFAVIMIGVIFVTNSGRFRLSHYLSG